MIDYYQKPALSYSGIKKYLTDGPHSFWRTSVFNPARIQEEPTKAMIEGNAAHTLLLEPAKFYARYAVKDKVDGRTVAGKAYNTEFAEKAGDKIIIDSEVYLRLTNMVDYMKAHPEFKKLTAQPFNVEEEYIWQNGVDPEDDFQYKAKADIVIQGKEEIIILDYKTCQNCDPKHFQKDIINQKYYLQAAFYKWMYKCKYGAEPRFIFIAQEIDWPENIAFYEMSPADLAVAYREFDKASEEIKARLATNNWKPYNGGIQQLDLPTWFYTRQQESENEGN